MNVLADLPVRISNIHDLDMLIRILAVIGSVFLIIAYSVSEMLSDNDPVLSPIERQCMDEGIDIPSKCERPYSL